jgi:pSer/pThr/pTyr-binding forkhead associated (FHA) protein
VLSLWSPRFDQYHRANLIRDFGTRGGPWRGGVHDPSHPLRRTPYDTELKVAATMLQLSTMSSGQFRSVGTRIGKSHSAARDPAGGYWLRIGKREVRLDARETLIGRDESCHIVVNGPLVSRQHARIVLEGVELTIEDLGSANGTFVNRARIHGRMPLRPGDSIFVGCEIEVLRTGCDSLVENASPEEEEDEDRKTPLSGVSVVGRVALSQRQSDALGVATERGERRTTFDVTTLESAGRLADRMFALGRVDAGRQILAEPLLEIVGATRSGRSHDSQLVDAVGRCAMRLAQETLDGKWVNLAIEIHLAVARPLRAVTLQQLLAIRAKISVVDDALIARYYERLRSRRDTLDSTDRVLCEQIAALVPRLDENQ